MSSAPRLDLGWACGWGIRTGSRCASERRTGHGPRLCVSRERGFPKGIWIPGLALHHRGAKHTLWFCDLGFLLLISNAVLRHLYTYSWIYVLESHPDRKGRSWPLTSYVASGVLLWVSSCLLITREFGRHRFCFLLEKEEFGAVWLEEALDYYSTFWNRCYVLNAHCFSDVIFNFQYGTRWFGAQSSPLTVRVATNPLGDF